MEDIDACNKIQLAGAGKKACFLKIFLFWEVIMEK